MDLDFAKLSPKELSNVQVAAGLTLLVEKYEKGEIPGTDFAADLQRHLSKDVVFRSNYVPTWEPLRPLFSERHGIDGILERYEYENQHEKLVEGAPCDFAINSDKLYYTQRETAKFFGGKEVTWNMVTKIDFSDGKICKIEMYVDAGPIEEAYSAEKMRS